MCDPISATIGAAVIGAAATGYSASKASKTANKQMAQSERQAADQAQRAEQQFNRLNQKQPGIEAIIARNQRAAGRGLGSTFLTGTKGVPTGSLPLGGGGSTMLGG